ncbi:hypothetical protein OIO90_002073 [Microbotryomycetes sp. JL221]|nr:hypothetical protein OIO90_002073 [Microbotryomycetes sp. JL221]
MDVVIAGGAPLKSVIKTHKLTYSPSSALYARASRATCTSSWLAPSRVLKDWTDHFHLKTGSTGGGTDEISFYHSDTACVLKSFGADVNQAVDYLGSRPLGTELMVDVGDFERYDVDGSPLITINLKELKAIIALADATETNLDAAFTQGGSPFLVEVNSDDFKADFVIATTDFDSGEPDASGSVKRERAEPVPPARRVNPSLPMRAQANDTTNSNANASRSGSSSARPALFNAPSQQQQHQQDADQEDEFGNEDDFDDAAFAEIDRLSQALSQRHQASQGDRQQRAAAVAFAPNNGTLVEEQEEAEPDTEDDDDMVLGHSPPPADAVPPNKKARQHIFD